MKKLKIWLITLAILIAMFPCSVFAYTSYETTWDGPQFTWDTKPNIGNLALRIHPGGSGDGALYIEEAPAEGVSYISSRVWSFYDLSSVDNANWYGQIGFCGNSKYTYKMELPKRSEGIDFVSYYSLPVNIYYWDGAANKSETVFVDFEPSSIYKSVISSDVSNNTITFEILASQNFDYSTNRPVSYEVIMSRTYSVSSVIVPSTFASNGYSKAHYIYGYDFEYGDSVFHYRPVYNSTARNTYSWAQFDTGWNFIRFKYITNDYAVVENRDPNTPLYDWLNDPLCLTVYGTSSIVTEEDMIKYLLQKTYPVEDFNLAVTYFDRIYNTYIKTLQNPPLQYVTIMRNRYTSKPSLIRYSGNFKTTFYHIGQNDKNKVWNVISNKTDDSFTMTFNLNAYVQNTFKMRYDVWKDIYGLWSLPWLYEKGYVDYSNIINTQFLIHNDPYNNIENGMFENDSIRETIDFEKVETTMDDLYAYDENGTIKKFCYYASPVYYDEEENYYEWFYLVTYSGGKDSELKDIYNYYSYVSDDTGKRIYRLYDSIQPLSWNWPKKIINNKQNDWKYVDHNIRDVVYKSKDYDASLDKNVQDRNENIVIYDKTTETEALENIGFKTLINTIGSFVKEFESARDKIDAIDYYLTIYTNTCKNSIVNLTEPEFITHMNWMSDQADWLYDNTIIKYPVNFGLVSLVILSLLF